MLRETSARAGRRDLFRMRAEFAVYAINRGSLLLSSSLKSHLSSSSLLSLFLYIIRKAPLRVSDPRAGEEPKLRLAVHGADVSMRRTTVPITRKAGFSASCRQRTVKRRHISPKGQHRRASALVSRHELRRTMRHRRRSRFLWGRIDLRTAIERELREREREREEGGERERRREAKSVFWYHLMASGRCAPVLPSLSPPFPVLSLPWPASPLRPSLTAWARRALFLSVLWTHRPRDPEPRIFTIRQALANTQATFRYAAWLSNASVIRKP